eukprot:1052639-Amphidinium_carterae.2
MLQRDQPLVFLRRKNEYYNDHIALSMTTESDYCTSLLSLYNIKENTKSLSTTGTIEATTHYHWRTTQQ